MRQRYSTPLGPTWFLGRAGYRRFMAREATAFAMEVIELTKHPISVFVLSLIFGAVLYHSFTWFNLTPQIMPMYVAEEKVPNFWAAIIMGYLPWAATTAVVLWSVLRWTGS